MSLKLVFNSTNNHKVQEMKELLKDYDIELLSTKDLNIELGEIIEDGKTYQENALIKAKALAKLTKLPVFSDDSGFEVIQFGHVPGINSHRFATSYCGYYKGCLELSKRINESSNPEDTRCQFYCCIALVNLTDEPLLFTGFTKGNFDTNVKKHEKDFENGFGYDPIFIPEGYEKTFSELGKKIKDQVSHRSRAIKAMLDYLLKNNYIIKIKK